MARRNAPMGKAADGHHNPDAVERLYVYWLVSTLILLLAVVIIGFFAGGVLRREAATLNRLADVEQQVAELRAEFDGLATLPTPSASQTVSAPPPAPAEPRPRQPERPPTEHLLATTAPAPAPAIPPEADVRTEAERWLPDDVASGELTGDPQAGQALVSLGLEHFGDAPWSADTWISLALVARLIQRDAAAETFARRAATSSGADLRLYDEVSARSFLARRRPQGAEMFAARLAAAAPNSETARVLHAAALLLNRDYTRTEDMLAPPVDPAVLTPQDRLVLARVLVGLEHWEAVNALLATVTAVPDECISERNFMQAVGLTAAGRTVEALALLDALQGTETSTGDSRAWPAPGPDAYEIEVWRGVTLAHAGQVHAAQDVLQSAAQTDPSRPDAYYELGRLAIRAGQPELAETHLKNALAADARLAPAWEVLGLLEIDAGQAELALEHVGRAIELNGRRASAHFLQALAYAKLGQKNEAALALRAALTLDPSYLTEAQQTEVLTRLFTPDELAGLTNPPAGESSGTIKGESGSAP